MKRLLITALVVVALLAAIWAGLTGSTQPSEPEDSLFFAVLFTVAVVIFTAWSERRVLSDLGQAQRAAHTTATTVAGSATGRRQGITGLAVSGLTRGSMDAIDLVAAVMAAGMVPAAVGWWVGWQPRAVWIIGPALGIIAAWALARRYAAWRGLDLRLRQTLRWPHLGPIAVTTTAVIGGISGWLGWTYAGARLGGVETPTQAAMAAMGAGTFWLIAEAREQAAARRRAYPVASQLAAVLGITDGTLAETRWRVKRDGSITMPAPLIAPILARLGGIEERIPGIAPGWEVEVASAAEGIRIIGVQEATAEQRRITEQTEGMVIGVQAAPEGRMRPGHLIWRLAPTVTKAAAPRLTELAHQQGLELVDFAPERRAAHLARLDPATRSIRARVAVACKAEPWQVEVSVRMAEGVTPPRPEQVAITRMPALARADERRAVLEELAYRTLPGASHGWQIDDRQGTGTAILTWGPKPALPTIAPLAELIPPRVMPEDWAHLPIGVGPDGVARGINLKAGPHALVVGQTGSGKTIGLQALMVSALAVALRVSLDLWRATRPILAPQMAQA